MSEEKIEAKGGEQISGIYREDGKLLATVFGGVEISARLAHCWNHFDAVVEVLQDINEMMTPSQRSLSGIGDVLAKAKGGSA